MSQSFPVQFVALSVSRDRINWNNIDDGQVTETLEENDACSFQSKAEVSLKKTLCICATFQECVSGSLLLWVLVRVSFSSWFSSHQARNSYRSLNFSSSFIFSSGLFISTSLSLSPERGVWCYIDDSPCIVWAGKQFPASLFYRSSSPFCDSERLCRYSVSI